MGYQGQDDLQLASDAGAVLTTLLELPKPMGGFARIADGTVWVVDGAGDLWSSRDGGFDLRVGPHGSCLGARGDSLFVCGSSVYDGFDLGRSDDQGQTFQPLLLLSNKSQVLSYDCSSGDGGSAGGGMDGGMDAGASMSGNPPPSPSRCGCESGEGGLALVGFLAMARRLMRRNARRTLRHVPSHGQVHPGCATSKLPETLALPNASK